MLLHTFGVDQDVIDIDKHALPNEGRQNVIHYVLKRTGCIAQAKTQHSVLVEALMR